MFKKYFKLKAKANEFLPIVVFTIGIIVLLNCLLNLGLNMFEVKISVYLIFISGLSILLSLIPIRNSLGYYKRRVISKLIIYIILFLVVLLSVDLGVGMELLPNILNYLMVMFLLEIWSTVISIFMVFFNTSEKRKEQERFDEENSLIKSMSDNLNIDLSSYKFINRIDDSIRKRPKKIRLQDSAKLKLSYILKFVIFWLLLADGGLVHNFKIFVTLIVYIYLSITWNPYKFRVNTSFVGVNASNYFNKPIIILGYQDKISKHSRIFELNISSLIPEKAKILNVDFTCNKIKNKVDTELSSDPNVFVVINSYKKKKYIIDKLIIRYNIDKNNYEETFVLEVTSEMIGNQLLITSCLVVDFSTFALKRNPYTKYLDTLEYESNDCINMIHLLNNYYFFEKEFTDLELLNSSQDSRKFIIHDDKFGNGKSSYDTLFIYESQKVPISISLWQENYEHEMLFVLFNRLRKKTNKLFMSFTYQTIPTFIGIILIFVSFAIFVIDKSSNFPSLLAFRIYLINMGIPTLALSKFAFMLGSILIGILVSLIYAPEFIIYKQNTSEYYQDFYLKKIKEIIEKKNVVLVIEDLDRLPIDSIEKCFRVIANLNYQLSLSERKIGVISYDEEIIRKKYAEKYAKKCNAGDKTDYYQEIIEKIAIEEKISPLSHDENFKKAYMLEILDYYKKCLIMDVQIPKSKKKLLNKQEKKYIEIAEAIEYKKITLRDIRSIIDVMINSCDSKTYCYRGDKVLDFLTKMRDKKTN